MKKLSAKGISRRHFIGATAAGVAGIAMLSSLLSCRKSEPDTDLKLGFIGVGRQAMYLLDGFIGIEGVKVVAGCDVYGSKRQRFENRVNACYQQAGKKVEVKT